MRGWGACDDYQEQIEQTVLDRMSAARADLERPGTLECVECENEIPAARRKVYPSAIRCVRCQSIFEKGR